MGHGCWTVFGSGLSICGVGQLHCRVAIRHWQSLVDAVRPMSVWVVRKSTALSPVRFASSASAAMRLYQAVSSRRSCCLSVVARRCATTFLPHGRAVRCSSVVPRVSSLIHWYFFLRRGPITAWLVSFRANLPSCQIFSMDEAESSDSDRSAKRLCSFSTKCCCMVGSRSFSTTMGGEFF